MIVFLGCPVTEKVAFAAHPSFGPGLAGSHEIGHLVKNVDRFCAQGLSAVKVFDRILPSFSGFASRFTIGEDKMLMPTVENLRRHCRSGQSMFCSGTLGWLGQNPLFYKFMWWIFSEESKVDGNKFLGHDKFALCTSDAIKLIDRLTLERKPFLVYNRRCRRAGPDTPFKKWDGKGDPPKLAPAFCDDPDPEIEGHR